MLIFFFFFEEKLFLNHEFSETFGQLTDLVILHYEKIYCILLFMGNLSNV